jgi:hypothetical protein
MVRLSLLTFSLTSRTSYEPQDLAHQHVGILRLHEVGDMLAENVLFSITTINQERDAAFFETAAKL